jgi:modulator of FtsH protease
MAVGSAITPTLTLRASQHTKALSRATFARVVTAITWTACLITTGVTLIAGAGGGLFWLPAAFLLAISVAAINAWILLVEVLR